MPAIAAIGSAIGTAVGGMTLAGLATGATIAGTGLSLIGMATGSKTLTKIGMGLGLAGGVTSLATGFSGAGALATGASGTKGILDATDDVSHVLSSTKSTKAGAAGLKQPKISSGLMDDSMTKFDAGVSKIGDLGKFDPQFEKTYWERVNGTLTKYNPLINVVGGMGEAYMMNERMDLSREMQDKSLDFEQKNLDWQRANYLTKPGAPSPQFGRDTNAYAPLLQRNY